MKLKIPPALTSALDLFKNVPGIITALGTLLVAAIYIFQHFRNPALILSPVTLPAKLSEQGLSSRELTERLLDRIDSLRESARPSVSKSGWVIESDMKYPDITIPGIKMSLPALFSILDGTFGHRSSHVTWEVSGRPKGTGAAAEIWIVRAAVDGGRLHYAKFDANDPDAALTAIATAILADAEPYLAIRMLRFAERCDEARALATRELKAARTPAQRVVATNVMGFVSECGFDETGANTDDAELFYRKAISIDSLNPQPHANLGRLLAEQGDSAESRHQFELAARLGPTLAGTYEAWGYSLMLAGDYAGAVQKLTRAIDLDPNTGTASINLGYAYLNLQDSAKAIDALGSGVMGHPDIAALKQYGHLLIAHRRWNGAADAFRRASRLAAGDVDAEFWLAFSLDSAGKKDAAKLEFENVAKQSRPGDVYCAAALKRLAPKSKCGSQAPRGRA